MRTDNFAAVRPVTTAADGASADAEPSAQDAPAEQGGAPSIYYDGFGKPLKRAARWVNWTYLTAGLVFVGVIAYEEPIKLFPGLLLLSILYIPVGIVAVMLATGRLTRGWGLKRIGWWAAELAFLGFVAHLDPIHLIWASIAVFALNFVVFCLRFPSSEGPIIGVDERIMCGRNYWTTPYVKTSGWADGI